MPSFSEKRKKVEIQIPEDMSEEVAQQCFLIGMKTYAESNSSGLCVSHGLERNGQISLKMMSFRGEYAAAIVKFCDGVYFLQEGDMDKNLWTLKTEGSKILKDLQEGKKING